MTSGIPQDVLITRFYCGNPTYKSDPYFIHVSVKWTQLLPIRPTNEVDQTDYELSVTTKSWWRHQMETFSALPAIFAGNHRSPVNSPHKGQWRGALMFSLICVLINDWVNNREAGDLRRYRAHNDVTVMNDSWWDLGLTECRMGELYYVNIIQRLNSQRTSFALGRLRCQLTQNFVGNWPHHRSLYWYILK